MKVVAVLVTAIFRDPLSPSGQDGIGGGFVLYDGGFLLLVIEAFPRIFSSFFVWTFAVQDGDNAILQVVDPSLGPAAIFLAAIQPTTWSASDYDVLEVFG